MVTYEFCCEGCGFHGLTEQRITDSLPVDCPDCGAYGPTFHQVYGGDQFAFVKGEPTTFAQQAERNAQRVGKEQMQKMAEDAKEANHKGKRQFDLPRGATPTKEKYKPARPWWRPHQDQPLDVSKIKNPRKFIETGWVQ